MNNLNNRVVSAINLARARGIAVDGWTVTSALGGRRLVVVVGGAERRAITVWFHGAKVRRITNSDYYGWWS